MGDAPDGNRTIQIDALTDVQLVALETYGETPSAAPPPLPRRRPSRARVIVLTALASIAGLVLAMIAVRFLFPPPPASVAPAVHHVQIDGLVIHAGDTAP